MSGDSRLDEEEITAGPLGPPPSTLTVYRAVAAVGVASVVVFAAIMAQSRVPVGYLTRDPSATSEEAWYLGLASSLGVVGWTVAATIFGFGALLARALHLSSATTRGLLAASGMTTVLLIDDLFLVHDDILLRAIGSEKPVLAVYALMFVTWLAVSRSHITRLSFTPLVAAAVGFACSVAVDRVWDSERDLRLLIEDGAKFFGIWSWVVFACVYTFDEMARSHRSPRGEA